MVFKVVVVGLGGAGKSRIVVRFISNSYEEIYDPTLEDSYRKTFKVDGKEVVLEIYDTAGAEDFANVRDQYIRKSDGVILVYSIANSFSFQEIQPIYEHILKINEMEWVPSVLVGCQCDRENYREVTKEEGEELAKKLGISFLEVSAKENINIENVFIQITKEIQQLRLKTHEIFLKLKESTPGLDLSPLLELSPEDLINYLNGIARQSLEVIRKKILFVGDARIGKTTLMKCFLNKSRSKSTIEPETVGVDVNEWKFSMKFSDRKIEVSATLWDFAGQEEYYPCHQFFFSESSLILLIFDMEAFSKNSLQVKKRVIEWAFSIRSRIPIAEEVSIILVGTHLDRIKEKSEEILSEMSDELKSTFSKDCHLLASFGVDCISGKNTENLINFIKEKCLKPQVIPALYFKIMEELSKLNKNTISYKEFEEICMNVQNKEMLPKTLKEDKKKPAVLKILNSVTTALTKKEKPPEKENKVPENMIVNAPILETPEEKKEPEKKIRVTIMNSSEIQTCARILHLWGYIVRFEYTKSNLKDLVITNPTWLTKVVGTFIYNVGKTIKSTDPRIRAFFDTNNAEKIWKDQQQFPREKYDAFFELLANFELLYWMPSSSKYLIPSLLPELSSELKRKRNPSWEFKKRTFEFSWIFPIGFLHRLMIQILQLYSSSKSSSFVDYTLWKSGVTLMWPQGHITLEEEERKLDILVQGSTIPWIDKKMNEILSLTQDLISSNFPGSKVTHFVHCICETHSWPHSQKDEEGLLKSIFSILEQEQSFSCSIGKNIKFEQILLNEELMMAKEKGWIISPSVGVNWEKFSDILDKPLCEVVKLESLIGDNELIEALLGTKVHFCLKFPCISHQWRTWEQQLIAFPKEFILKVLDAVYEEYGTTFRQFIEAVQEIMQNSDITPLVSKWTNK